MSAIEKIKEKFKKYPQINFEENANAISVLPSSEKGFTVTLEINHDGFKVFYNGWHDDFEDEEEALHCFAFGLSNGCRLKEVCRGDQPYKWTLEYKDGENWVKDSTVCVLNFSLWKRVSVQYLQNDLIR